MKKLQAIVSGRVQGVGFRYFVRATANRLNLAGWVRNLPDGRVEVEAEGSEEDLEEMITRLHAGPGLSRVDYVDHTMAEPTHEFVGFEVR